MTERPSFARYAALLAGVLHAPGADTVGADASHPDESALLGELERSAAERSAYDRATRSAACALRRPAAAPPGAPRSRLDAAYRGTATAALAAAAAADVRLDRRG